MSGGTENVRGPESNVLSERSESKGTNVHLRLARRRCDYLPPPIGFFQGYSVFHVYLLRCADGTFYAGSFENLADRVATHNRGEGASWTARRRPVELVHAETFATRAEAVARERQRKRWSHAKKVALAAGDTDRLRALAKRRRN
ncbi:MAG: GIY-YIG nuclease family protein [Phycisphaeraceae bacterium]|nr:GIY-YIG nuclease family protein [Phycisphaeraceae bacterium]